MRSLLRPMPRGQIDAGAMTDRAEARIAAAGCGILAAAIAATQVLVDAGAEASFDAPKRLAALAGIAIAAIAGAVLRRPFAPCGRSALARLAAVLAAVAMAGVIASALASSRPTGDALRRLVLLALALPLGASRLLDSPARSWLARGFIGTATLGAVLALLEHAAGLRLFEAIAVAGRGATGGLAGNEGQLALVLALAAVPTLAGALGEGRPRAALAVVLVLLLAGVAVTGAVTALLALVAGSAIVLLLRFGRRALGPGGAVLAVAAITAVAVGPLHQRLTMMVADARAGDWDDFTSNRLGPWAAAVEMVRERPWLGVGPGAFGAEFVPHRLAAEVRHQTRLVIPALTSSYAEAHCEPLQAAAEWGFPAGVAAAGAVALVLVGLVRARDTEDLALAGFLGAAAVAALTWFPVQQASTSLPVLLALGRGWRRIG